MTFIELWLYTFVHVYMDTILSFYQIYQSWIKPNITRWTFKAHKQGRTSKINVFCVDQLKGFFAVQEAFPRLLKQLAIIRPPLWNQLPHNQRRVHEANELKRPKERQIFWNNLTAPLFDSGGRREKRPGCSGGAPGAVHFWKPPFQRGN